MIKVRGVIISRNDRRKILRDDERKISSLKWKDYLIREHYTLKAVDFSHSINPFYEKPYYYIIPLRYYLILATLVLQL